MEEIKVRVSKFGKCSVLWNRIFHKCEQTLPKNDDKITITWLPPCINGEGTPNPYIGMTDIVQNINIAGDFDLHCETSILICSGGKFNYIK